jgi:hypothetical protein
MPGSGKFEIRERAAADSDGLTAEDRDLPGEQVLDIYLNDHPAGAGRQARRGTTRSGGFQVLRKWLSYRERRALG